MVPEAAWFVAAAATSPRLLRNAGARPIVAPPTRLRRSNSCRVNREAGDSSSLMLFTLSGRAGGLVAAWDDLLCVVVALEPEADAVGAIADVEVLDRCVCGVEAGAPGDQQRGAGRDLEQRRLRCRAAADLDDRVGTHGDDAEIILEHGGERAPFGQLRAHSAEPLGREVRGEEGHRLVLHERQPLEQDPGA